MILLNIGFIGLCIVNIKASEIGYHIIAQTTEGLVPLTEAHIWNSVAST